MKDCKLLKDVDVDVLPPETQIYHPLKGKHLQVSDIKYGGIDFHCWYVKESDVKAATDDIVMMPYDSYAALVIKGQNEIDEVVSSELIARIKIYMSNLKEYKFPCNILLDVKNTVTPKQINIVRKFFHDNGYKEIQIGMQGMTRESVSEVLYIYISKIK